MCDACVRVTTNARTHDHTPLSYSFVAGSGDRETVMRGTFLNKLALYTVLCASRGPLFTGMLGLVTDPSQFVTDCGALCNYDQPDYDKSVVKKL